MRQHSNPDEAVAAPAWQREGSRQRSCQQHSPNRQVNSGEEFKILRSFNDGVYVGMVVNSLPHGHGMYRSAGGVLYVGEFYQGAYNGYGEIKQPGRIYKGQFSRGQMSGVGAIKNKKSSAVSHFSRDKKHGAARISNGDRKQQMEGYYKEGETGGFCIVRDNTKNVVLSGMFDKTVLNGIGKEESPQTVFIGNFKQNKKWGVGTLTCLETNTSYSGFWKDGEREGFGVLTDTINNETYEGGFLKGLKHGIGILKNHQKPARYIGRFENDHYEGTGKLELPGSFYLGNFHLSCRSGLGYERSDSEEIYFGSWKQDLRDGIGLDRNPQREYQGSWSEDLPHGQALITIDGRTKAAIYEHGKIAGLLPDTTIDDLEQDFESLNFEEFIHPISKRIEDYFFQVENNKQALTLQLDHVERLYESAYSKLRTDLANLDDQNATVQERCSRMACALDTVFKSNGLELRKLATLPYPDLVTELARVADKVSDDAEPICGTHKHAPRADASVSPNIEAQDGNIEIQELESSVRFDHSGPTEEQYARVTPSLTLRGGEEFSAGQEYKASRSTSKSNNRDPEKRVAAVDTAPIKKHVVGVGQKRISMSDVSANQLTGRSPGNKKEKLVRSQLAVIPSQMKKRPKERTTLQQSRVAERNQNSSSSDDEIGFITNKKGATARLAQKKHLGGGNHSSSTNRYEEEERMRRVEAERKELHARRREKLKEQIPSEGFLQSKDEPSSERVPGFQKPYNSKPQPSLAQPVRQAQRTVPSQSVPDADNLSLNQANLVTDSKAEENLNQVPKAKMHASLLVSQFSLQPKELDPVKGDIAAKQIDEEIESPEFDRLSFAPIREIGQVQKVNTVNPDLKPQAIQEDSQPIQALNSVQSENNEAEPNPDASFEELIRLRESQNTRRSTVKQLLLSEPTTDQTNAVGPSDKMSNEIKPEVDVNRLLTGAAVSAGAKGKQELQRIAEEERRRKVEEEEAKAAKAAKEAKNLLAFKKSMNKLKSNIVERHELLNLGVTLVNRIMEEFNEDGEEHEKPLNSPTFTAAEDADLQDCDDEIEFLKDPAEFSLLAKGYQSFRKLDADERGHIVSVGGFKSLDFLQVNPKTKEYKTLEHYPSSLH